VTITERSHGGMRRISATGADQERAVPFTVGRTGLLVILSGQKVKDACIMRGWSLAELARRARVSRPTLRSALRGRPLRPRTAWLIARALRAGETQPELDDLFGAA
jgi:lambda repressor-like predicted transcriptional regulator